MARLIAFFEEMSPVYRLLWVLGCLAVAWLLEYGWPLFRLTYRKWRHAAVNLSLLAISVAINLVFGLVVIWSLAAAGEAGFGLFPQLSLSLGWQLVLTILFLDGIAQYLAHYLLHKVRWMWRLHMVHHSDTKVDATTGTRHHPGDFLLREVFSLGVMLLLGAPLAFYLLYRFLTVFFTYFTHANIQLPPQLDRALSWVLVTPHMHKFHHHHERPWTDSNYGNIFSIWDRLMGTFTYANPREIVYGLDVLDGQTDEDLRFQLGIPFNRNIKTD